MALLRKGRRGFFEETFGPGYLTVVAMGCAQKFER